MLIFTALFLSLASVTFGNGPQYYGVPLGSLVNSADGTQGEIYASDPRTLTVVHFSHNAQPGCTTFMLGPPKSGLGSSSNEGVLLSVKSQKQQRSKRQSVARQPLVPQIAANNPNFHPFDWPFELAHLRVDESAKSLDAQPGQVQDPFKVELEKSNNSVEAASPHVTPDPETTVNFVGESSPSEPITRIRTMHIPTEKPEINEAEANETSPVYMSYSNATTEPRSPPEAHSPSSASVVSVAAVASQMSHAQTSPVSSASSSAAQSSPISPGAPNNSSSSSSSSSTTSAAASSSSSAASTPEPAASELSSSAAHSTAAAASGAAAEVPLSGSAAEVPLNGFIEELPIDDLHGTATTKKWTLPPNLPIEKIPVLQRGGGPRTSVVLHSKNSVIFEAENRTSNASAPNIEQSISEAGENQTKVDDGSVVEQVPMSYANESSSQSAQTTVEGSGSEEEYEDDATTDASVTKSGHETNRTFAQRVFTRGSTTANPSGDSEDAPSTKWQSVPIGASTQASNKGSSERATRKPRPKPQAVQNQPKSESSGGPTKGGIQWEDHTRSPAARQRGEDIKNAANGESRSIYDLPPKSEGGKAQQAQKFWGPLPREPTEYFGGLNIPDDIENKGPQYTIGPLITRKGKSHQGAGPGVTFAFGFGSAADQAQPRTVAPPPVDRWGSASSSRSSNRNSNIGAPSARGLDNGPPSPPSPPGSSGDFYADRRAQLQAERHAAYNGDRKSSSDPSSSSSSSSSSASPRPESKASTKKADGPSTTPDPNALFVVVDDPHHRTFAPFVPPTVGSPTQAPLQAGRDWVIVEDRPSKRNQQRGGKDASQERQPAAANLIINKQSNIINSAEKTVAEKDADGVDAVVVPTKETVLKQDEQLPSLAKSNDETLTLVIPEQYKLTDFQWVGIYDRCQKQRTAFVSINDVETPKVVGIDGIKGWQYNVKSNSISVINCNTMLINNFTYNGAEKTNAYFFVGSGDFPRNVVRKIRIDVVGPTRNQPLRNYNGDNVLVKLPDGLKTFDITWIAVFGENDNVNYGHAFVPPLIVPPCGE